MGVIVANLAGDQQLSLGNEEFLRGMAFGTDWNYLRIGLRYGVQFVSNMATPAFVVGVNAGTTSGYRSASTPEFVGAQMAGDTNLAWNFNAGYYFTTYFKRYVYRTGSTTNLTKTDTTLSYGTVYPNRGFFLVDIFKNFSAGNIGVMGIYAANTATATADQTKDYFLRSMCQDNLPQTGTWGAVALQAVPYNGSYTFDSVSISWNDNVNKILISDLLVVRYA